MGGRLVSCRAALTSRLKSMVGPDSRCIVDLVQSANSPQEFRKRSKLAVISQHWSTQRRPANTGLRGLRARSCGTRDSCPEQLDTVGVTGSIPVSPTNGGPGFRGLQAFPRRSRAAPGSLERRLCWLRTVRLWPRCGPADRPTLTTGSSGAQTPRGQSAIGGSDSRCLVGPAMSEHCNECLGVHVRARRRATAVLGDRRQPIIGGGARGASASSGRLYLSDG
jgi:hypothetical protein